jgi:hypothetical protein
MHRRNPSPRAILIHGGFALLVSIVLLLPVIVTDRTFGLDWSNHLWMIAAQGDSISHGGPSFFLNTNTTGVFYPHFAFYGGPLYAIAGTLADLFGSPTIAYILMWFIGFWMAYGGMLWLSFQAGLRGWQAHAAPLIVLTSAYYLTNAYQRGAFTELIAVSAIPLLLASALSILRSPRVTAGPAAALLIATLFFTGSHNITLLWGSIVIAALLVTSLITLPALRKFELSRLWIVLGLGALAVGLNAWFLLPDVAYAKNTFIAGDGMNFIAPPGVKFFTPFTHHYASFTNLFTPVRRIPPDVAGYPAGYAQGLAFYTQLPVLVFAWVIVVGLASIRTGISSRLRWALAGGVVIMAALLVLLMFNSPWLHLPKTLQLIQFSFRIESYVVFVLALLVVGLLLAMRSWDARFKRLATGFQVALAVILVISVGQGVAQAWHKPSSKISRSAALTGPHKTPPNWYAITDFRDLSAPFVNSTATAQIDPAKVKDDRFSGLVKASPPGSAAVATNIAAGDYLAEVTKARSLGRTLYGLRVIGPTAGSGKEVAVTVAPAKSAATVAGRWITYISVLILLGLTGFAGFTAVARRR